VGEIIPGYERNGASALSVLTDNSRFAGSVADVLLAKQKTGLPVLRKEFIIDEYQLVESRAYGADLVLLIAAALSPAETLSLAKKARELGMEVLLELHGENELEHINEYVSFLGVNNRNLQTMKVDLSVSIGMARKLPQEFPWVSESGIKSASDIKRLSEAGFELFLIGEAFMESPDPGAALRKLLDEVNAEG
jgi:indole-3-glycerol phosphate synthase